MSDIPDDELIREAEAEVEEALHGPERKLAALEERASSPQPVEVAPVVAEALPPTAAPGPIPPPPVEPTPAPEQSSAIDSRSPAERLLDEYATWPRCPTCGRFQPGSVEAPQAAEPPSAPEPAANLCPMCGQPPPHHFTIEELEAIVRAGAKAAPPTEPSLIDFKLTEAADILQRAFPVSAESPRPPLKPPRAHAVLVKLMEKHADEPDVVEALTTAAKILSVNLYPGFEPVSVRAESYLIAPDSEGDARARYHAPFRPSWLDSYDLTKWRVEAWYVEGQQQPLGFLSIGGCTKTCHAGADVVLRVKNLSKDTACFTGELVGYARRSGR